MQARRRKGDKEITDVQLAAKVSRVVAITRITLRAAELRSSFDPDNPPQKLTPQQQAGATYRLKEHGALHVTATFLLELKGEVIQENAQAPALRVQAEYEVVYQLPPDATFEEKELTHFAQLNGTMNLWPYWRELVHTAAARVGIGSITMPVYRVKPKVVEVRDPAAESA